MVPSPPETEAERQEREREEEEAREMGIEIEQKRRDMGPREIGMIEERHELHLISPRTWQVRSGLKCSFTFGVLSFNIILIHSRFTMLSSSQRNMRWQLAY